MLCDSPYCLYGINGGMNDTETLRKRTYTLPNEIVTRFEATVPSGSRSRAIAKLVEEWLERERQETLRREIIAGCQEMAEEYQAISDEYYPLEEEVAYAAD